MKPDRPLALCTVALLFVAAHAPCQDLLGVTWNGATVLIDSHTASVASLGMGLAGQNSLGRTGDGSFWSTQRVSATYYQYTRIDPNTGSATAVSYGADVRGLATAPDGRLYGIRNGTQTPNYFDHLVRIDPAVGITTAVGATGYSDIQGLAVHHGVLYAWDVFAGLLVVDPSTGAATDPFPAISGPAYQQSLCSHPDGRLLLGGGDSNGPDQLFVVDVTTGLATLIGTMPAMYDIRGIESLGGFPVWLGQGCDGAGGRVQLAVTGDLRALGSVSAFSANHAPNALGAVIFGLSTSVYGSYALPLLLDPVLGTNQCTLYTSIDISVIVVASGANPASLGYGFALPANAGGAVFNMQHACFEPVAGGTSWSNAVTLHIR